MISKFWRHFVGPGPSSPAQRGPAPHRASTIQQFSSTNASAMPGSSSRRTKASASASACTNASSSATKSYYVEVENAVTGVVEKWLLRPGKTWDEFTVRYALTHGTNYGPDDGIIIDLSDAVVDAGTGSTGTTDSTETSTNARTKDSTDAMTGASTSAKKTTDDAKKSTDANPWSTDDPSTDVSTNDTDASTNNSTDAGTVNITTEPSPSFLSSMD